MLKATSADKAEKTYYDLKNLFENLDNKKAITVKGQDLLKLQILIGKAALVAYDCHELFIEKNIRSLGL